MSNIYIQEPPTSGKICMKTSAGDIDIELWSKECPKACKNFVQHCMDGYYNGTIFHRVVPAFIVQGGDPTGTGMGGESIYGEPFKDEFHSRLKFVRRGLVAMANGGPNDNGSQFFFTLDKTPDLQGKHTIFGKVIGNTLYNMLKLGEVETDKNERPLHPHRINKTEVLNNPFPDVVPRKAKSAKEKEAEERKAKAAAVKAEKNFSLLSFGDEAEEEEETNMQFSGKGKSAHDLLNDEKLSSEPAVRKEEIFKEADEEEDEEKEKAQEAMAEKERLKRQVAEKLRRFGESSEQKSKKKQEGAKKQGEEEEEDLDNMLFTERRNEAKAQVDVIKNEYKQLQKELAKLSKKGQKHEEETDKTSEADQEEEKNDLMAAIKAEREKYSSGQKEVPKRKTGDREKETLAMLERFKAKMDGAKERHPSGDGGPTSLPSSSGLAKTTNYLDDEEDPLPTDDWLAHKFVVPEENALLHEAKDANVKTVESFDIYDPRNPMNKRRRENAEKAQSRDRGSHGRRDRDDDDRSSKRSRRDR